MIKISLIKVTLKGKVLLTFKDFIFLITWLVLLLFIADAFAGQARIAGYFLWVWEILGFIYVLKIVDNYNLQKKEEVKPESKIETHRETVKAPKTRFFEA